MLGRVIADVDAFHSALRRGKARNVNDQSAKDRAIALATEYFSSARPEVVRVLGEADQVVEHDQLWQQLVRMAHGNNPRRSYLRELSQIKKGLAQLNVNALTIQPLRASQNAATGALSTEERLIADTLERLVPSAAASYRQGLIDMFAADRLSYRGTAAEFREALRETLDHLAPDKAVSVQPGFRLEDGQTKPTMKQKVRFVLASRGRNKTQREAAEKTLRLVEELSGEVMRAVYNRASLATHVQESKVEVGTVKRYIDTVFFDLLELAK